MPVDSGCRCLHSCCSSTAEKSITSRERDEREIPGSCGSKHDIDLKLAAQFALWITIEYLKAWPRAVGQHAWFVQVKWRRITLDEAHSIKDRRCSTAKAVFALDSKYKWALSGTPLQVGCHHVISRALCDQRHRQKRGKRL